MVRMPRVQRLTSPTNRHIESTARLRRQRGRRETGLFIAEGVREVTRAMQAGLKLRDVFFCPTLIGGSDDDPTDVGALTGLVPALENATESVGVFSVTDRLLTKLAYRDEPEGVLAVLEQRVWSFEDVLDATHGPSLWLVAVGTTKPGNLGAMARSVAAAGGQALFVADGVVDIYNPNAIRASTGAVFELPIVADATADVRAFLIEHDVTFIAASPDAPTRYTDVDMTGPVALVLGAEDTGLPAVWSPAPVPAPGNAPAPANASGDAPGDAPGEALADALWKYVAVSIPMSHGVVDSLNASAAATLLLYEAVRQRTS